MHMKNKPPVYVPAAYRGELERLSKAALMDIAWDYARQLTGRAEDDPDLDRATIAELRDRAEIISINRWHHAKAKE